MRCIYILMMIACTVPKTTSDTSDADVPAPDTSTPDTPDVVGSTISATISGFSLPRRDQIYDMESLSSAGVGCVLVGDPYYDSFTGAVFVVCPGALDVPDDATTIWTGSGENQALGCSVELSRVYDGVYFDEFVGSSEFNDPTYEGRALMWNVSFSSDVAVNVSALDVVGSAAGDSFTGGYFGTMVRVTGDLIIASQTNAVPYLYGASVGELYGARLSDFSPLVVGGSSAVDTSTGGFAGYEASAGDDGTAIASFGGIVQHLDMSGVPDWWVDMDGSGAGEYPWPTLNDVTLWTGTSRLNSGEVVLSVFSRENRALGEDTYALVIDPVSGETLEDYSNVYGVESGVLDGVEWRVYGVEDCDPDFDDCRIGYLRVDFDSDKDGSLDSGLDVSLPFEADTFPSSGCLLGLTSDGTSEVGWFCKDQRYGGFLSLSVI